MHQGSTWLKLVVVIFFFFVFPGPGGVSKAHKLSSADGKKKTRRPSTATPPALTAEARRRFTGVEL